MFVDKTDKVNIQNEIEINRDRKSKRSVNLDFNRLDFSDSNVGFISGPQKRSGYKLSLWMWLSVTIDILTVIAFTSLLIIAAMFVINNAMPEIRFIFNRANMPITFLSGVIFVGWMYFIASRSLFGFSLGEWACSLRIGQPFERLHSNYVTKIILRCTLSLITGIIIFPLISILVRRDFLGKITGLYIYSLK